VALRTDDVQVQHALQILDQQRENMTQARSSILGLQSEIDNGIKCAAANVFHNRMQDWLDRYDLIRAKFDQIYENFQGAHTGINNAHQDALTVGGSSFGGGDSVFNGLRG
jgi:hypothetical protein